MKYSNGILAAVIAMTGMAQAADNSQLTEDEMSDIRVECISQGIADEQDDSLMDAYVEQCVQEQLAARQKLKAKEG